MAEGQVRLQFTATGATVVLEAIELLKRNATSANDVLSHTGNAARKERELAEASKLAAREAEKKAQSARTAAANAEREAQATERTARASAQTAQAKQSGPLVAQTSGGIAGGLGKGGNIKIEGAEKFRASSEVFSAGIRAAGVILATASVAMQDSANKFMQAAGKISSYAGMGWGVGQAFGGRGGAAGAVLGLSYGITSELTHPLFEKWAGTDEETLKKTDRARMRAQARRQSAYEEEKFEQRLGKIESADAAKNLVKSLEEELSEAQLKLKHGLDEKGTMQEKQARISAIEKRPSAAKEVEAELVTREQTKTEADRRNRIGEIERSAGRTIENKEWQFAFGKADTREKIEMLTAKLEENSRIIAEENNAFRGKAMTQEQFEWHRARYENALAVKTDLQAQLSEQQHSLFVETKDKEKKDAEKAQREYELRADRIASELNDAKAGYAVNGTELQRAGIAYGGNASVQTRIAQITADTVKNILTKLESGELQVVSKSRLPVVS